MRHPWQLMHNSCNRALLSSTVKLRIWTLRIWGFRGPGFRSARQLLCGDASRLLLDLFFKHLSSVLGRTELCHEVRNPGPQNRQIIHDENHHLALLDFGVRVAMLLLYMKNPRKSVATHVAKTKLGKVAKKCQIRGPRMGGWIRRGWIRRFWGAPIVCP